MRRRLSEEAASKRLAVADPTLTREERMSIVESVLSNEDLDHSNDEAMALALEASISAIDHKVKQARSTSISQQVTKMAGEDHEAFITATKKILAAQMSTADFEALSKLLSQTV